MKIAFFLYHWPVISETFIMNQITGLIDRGHEIDIYAKSPGKESVIHTDIDKYDMLARTTYYGSVSQRLPENKLLRIIKAIGLIIKHAPRKPKPVLNSLNFFKFGRPASSLGLFYDTLPFLDADQYDIIHCHFGPNGNRAALLKKVGAIKGKILTAFHGEAGYTKQRKYKQGFDHLFEAGDVMLPMSEKEKENLIALGCNPQKIIVHRMGVDLSRFTFSPRELRADGKAHLVTVARLVEKKGVEYAIKAVARVAAKHPNIDYTIVGDGPLRDDLERLIEKLNIGDKVHTVGWKKQQEVVEYIQGADIMLAPSVTSSDGDIEGIPVAMMEALAQGLPMLSTYHSGIPELIQDGVSGYLVPERDVEALANKLETMVTHPETWAEMGKAGRAYVEQYYNIDTLNDQLVALYQQLLTDT